MKRRNIKVVLAVLCMLLIGSACAEEMVQTPAKTQEVETSTEEIQETREEEMAWNTWESLYTYADQSKEQTRIDVQQVEGVNLLVLPSVSSPEAVSFFLEAAEEAQIRITGAKGEMVVHNGEAVDLTALCHGEEYVIALCDAQTTDSEALEVTVMFSQGVAAMYLCSDDPVSFGREWVEDSGRKQNKATGSMILQNEDGSIVYDGELTQIKGRGNSTWQCVKKPYQIKVKSKTDLLETQDESNESKTWVLLANYYDNTLIRNHLTLSLGKALGMASNIESRWVDLYYDAEYRGSYLLSEKVEIGEGRVDIFDLEKENENVNPEIDTDSIKRDTTENGATYFYCEGMESPQDITGGYLLEIDFQTRAEQEACYFITANNYYVVVKSPEYASKEEMEYIATWYQEFEDAVYNGGTHPTNGKHFSEYADLESMAKNYLVNEWTRNRDGFVSSTYFYKEAGQDVMVMGPLWDYDLCLGTGGGDSMTERVTPLKLRTATKRLGKAFCKLEDFCNAVKTIYQEEFRPMIQDVVMGDLDAVSVDGSLHSLEYYVQLVEATANCNDFLWYPQQDRAEEVEYIKTFIETRTQHLDELFASWIPGEALKDLE